MSRPQTPSSSLSASSPTWPASAHEGEFYRPGAGEARQALMTSPSLTAVPLDGLSRRRNLRPPLHSGQSMEARPLPAPSERDLGRSRANSSPTGYNGTSSRMAEGPPSFAQSMTATALSHLRSGRPDASLQLLHELPTERSDAASQREAHAVRIMALLASNRADAITEGIAQTAFLALETSRARPLEWLAVLQLGLASGQLSSAATAAGMLIGLSFVGCDAPLTVDISSALVRLSLLREDAQAALRTVEDARVAIGASDSASQARLLALELLVRCQYGAEIGPAQRANQRLADEWFLTSLTTPPGSAGEPGSAVARNILGLVQLELQQSDIAAARQQLHEARVHLPISDEAWVQRFDALEAMLAQAEARSGLTFSRRIAIDQLRQNHRAMGFEGELLHIALAERADIAFVRAQDLFARHPASWAAELLWLKYGTHVSQIGETLKERLDARPDDLELVVFGTEVALERGQRDEAWRLAQHAFALLPNATTAALRAQAAQLMELEYPRRLKVAQEALGYLGAARLEPQTAFHPKLPAIRLIVAEALIAQGEYAAATGHLRQLLDVSPGAVAAHVYLAEVEMKLGHAQAAEDHLTLFLDSSGALTTPLASLAFTRRAAARMALNKFQAARADLKAVSPAQPQHSAAIDEALRVEQLIQVQEAGITVNLEIKDLAKLVDTGKLREAEKHLRYHMMRPENQNNANLLTLLAMTYFKMGRAYDEATEQLARRAIRLEGARMREAPEASMILRDIARRNPSIVTIMASVVSSIYHLLTISFVDTSPDHHES